MKADRTPSSHRHPSRTSTPVAPARAAAFHILTRVASSAAHSDDLLHSAAVNALSPEDRNLTTTLVLGTLRWQLQLDTTLRPLLQRPDADLHPAALLALRMGLFQLLHLDRIPPHAALNESVELARNNGAPHAAGMVNAILRRVLRSKSGDLSPQRNPLAVAMTPAEQAHPEWLLARWRKHFGTPSARRLAEYDQQQPPLHGLFEADPCIHEMDDGSRLIAELAAAAVTTPRRILDCCAAPGGKTHILALRHPDAEIIAADVSDKRLSAMRRRMDASPSSSRVQTVVADMTKVQDGALFAAGFDLILCDAPCSGTGTLARNPEIRHRLRESDLKRQADRQQAILTSTLSLLVPGGRLVYSTCSMEPEENEAVMEAVRASVPNVTLANIGPILSNLKDLRDIEPALLMNHDATSLRTLPGTHPCDGFFVAILQR